MARTSASVFWTSPGLVNHPKGPQILLAALERASPLMDQQGKQDLAELREKQINEQQRYHDILDRQRTAAEAGRQNRADTREARLQQFGASREGIALQRLDQQQQAISQRASAATDRNELASLALRARALHDQASEIISSASSISNIDPDERKALLDKRRQDLDTLQAAIRARANGNLTPTGGTTPPGAPAAPKVQGQVPQNAPVVAPPPVSMLKPGGINVINGVGWRIGPDGQPVQVPLPGQ